MNNSLERNKGFTVALLAAAIVLLILVTAGLDSRLLSFTTTPSAANPVRAAAVDDYEELFAQDYFTNLVGDAKSRDVFATTYFNKPKPQPKPKPGTREVTISFMGAIENSAGAVTAFTRVDNKLRKLAAGDKVIDNWNVATVTGQFLTITNDVPATNSVPFQKTLKINVPIR